LAVNHLRPINHEVNYMGFRLADLHQTLQAPEEL